MQKSAIGSAGNCGYFRPRSYCSCDPSLAMILGVSQSNKSQVVLANKYRSDPIVIHPRRYGSLGLEKRQKKIFVATSRRSLVQGKAFVFFGFRTVV